MLLLHVSTLPMFVAVQQVWKCTDVNCSSHLCCCCMRVKVLTMYVAVQMVLKCADIGHLAAAPRTHRRWAFQLEEEFFRQVPAACS